MRIAVLAIGNELLDGLVVENNSIYLSKELSKIGLSVDQKMAVRDEKDKILSALAYLSGNSDIIIITGGLGPTEDDKTRETVAEFSGKKLNLDESILRWITGRFAHMKIKMAPENNKQAYVIEGSIVIPNPTGTAPGFILPGKPIITSFPGVPSELKTMLPDLLKYIQANYSIRKDISSVYFRTIGLPESYLDQSFKVLQNKGITVGTIAHFGQVDIRFDIPIAGKEKAMEIAKQELTAFPDIEKRVFSFNPEESIIEAVFHLLKAREKKVLFAESCTGGLLSKMITDIPGSSSVFLGSLVTYDNSLKQKILGVKNETLRSHGAVSFEAAREMLEGLKNIAAADYYISVTGIAGPDGGSPEKPVGTVFIGFGSKTQTVLMRFLFSAERDKNRDRSSMRVFEILWEALVYGSPDYKNYFGLIDFQILP